MKLERVGAYRGGPAELGGVPGFVTIDGGVVAWRRGEIVRLTADLDRVWSVPGAVGGASLEGDAVLSVDVAANGASILRRLLLADGAEVARAQRQPGAVLATVGGLQIRLECSPAGAELVGLDLQDLGLVWSRAWHPGPPMAAVADGLVLVNRELHARVAACILPLSGADLWSFPGDWESASLGDASGRITNIVAADGTFLVTIGPRIYKLEPKLGDVLGAASRPPGLSVKSEDSLFFVGTEGAIRFSPFAMREMERITFPPWPVQATSDSSRIHGAAVVGDTVALRTGGGDLVVMRRAASVWKVQVAAVGGVVPYSEAPVIANSRIYCLDRANYELAAFRLE